METEKEGGKFLVFYEDFEGVRNYATCDTIEAVNIYFRNYKFVKVFEPLGDIFVRTV